METNRKWLKTCIAAMVLLAGSASAQTIYKQVDDDGRVIFTDLPNPTARIVQSFETSRLRPQPSPDSEDEAARAVREPARRVMAEAPPSLPATSAPRLAVEGSPRVIPGDVPSAAAALPRGRGDVERAVFAYTALNTPLAAQVDATEAASRRARQQAASRDTGKAVLVVQQAPRPHVATPPPQAGLSAFYWMWVVTFLLLAAGLLYVAFQVFRLILGGAFPRWELGLA